LSKIINVFALKIIEHFSVIVNKTKFHFSRFNENQWVVMAEAIACRIGQHPGISPLERVNAKMQT